MNLDLRLDTKGDFYSQRFQPTEREDTLVLNMGPQHPSTHGVLRILLEIDGEYILRAEPVLGYIHRMHEKMAEVMSYPQYLPNPGRTDYLHALAWNWAHVAAVERLMGIEVPERAEYIRVITCELNRISSHLLWWGAILLDLGAFTPIMYAFDDRERIQDIMQRNTGSRLTYCYYRFGGVSADIDDKFIEATRAECARLKDRAKMFKDLVTDNFILRKRMEEVGEIPIDTCRKYGATGPVLRGSGQAYDVRRAEPYSIYNRFDFNIPTYDTCDSMGRYLVRMDEIQESIKIIEQALDTLPEGDYILPKAPKRPKPPAGDVYFALEGARGKIGMHLVSDGGKSPYRLKLRAPGFSNLSLFSEVAQGTLISDAIAILASLDLVIPEIDR
ncbi:NADH dehydrogenase (quinone) [Desulfonatronospira thiodismutans ASO3-1]|uniref:NADH-quinone oxidoreductase subunit D n=1 Tax=Desulfonatronospira thiodismutans ASO3-1 TaxID=555779 RepID=D6ST79_9BACT|nr:MULTISPECIES: NADH-quinone oxidoreductase subunit D [Desulfonatronospira]EFI33895.1 NADH dehydrogenase (quinone) [Desulfonatronospira thiodismutans ASO3-1]RQD78569.1 MAG: NADH-quinone oxidoreductase subunit D [Desulfonatronospira sp. MSAO_Bac3]